MAKILSVVLLSLLVLGASAQSVFSGTGQSSQISTPTTPSSPPSIPRPPRPTFTLNFFAPAVPAPSLPRAFVPSSLPIFDPFSGQSRSRSYQRFDDPLPLRPGTIKIGSVPEVTFNPELTVPRPSAPDSIPTLFPEFTYNPAPPSKSPETIRSPPSAPSPPPSPSPRASIIPFAPLSVTTPPTPETEPFRIPGPITYINPPPAPTTTTEASDN